MSVSRNFPCQFPSLDIIPFSPRFCIRHFFFRFSHQNPELILYFQCLIHGQTLRYLVRAFVCFCQNNLKEQRQIFQKSLPQYSFILTYLVWGHVSHCVRPALGQASREMGRKRETDFREIYGLIFWH